MAQGHEQQAVPCTLIRGRTSKGLHFRGGTDGVAHSPDDAQHLYLHELQRWGEVTRSENLQPED